MWKALKNVETGIIHAVSMPTGMCSHGFAMDWPLVETSEPITCHQCLQHAFEWRWHDGGLKALLPADLGEPVGSGCRGRGRGALVKKCC